MTNPNQSTYLVKVTTPAEVRHFSVKSRNTIDALTTVLGHLGFTDDVLANSQEDIHLLASAATGELPDQLMVL